MSSDGTRPRRADAIATLVTGALGFVGINIVRALAASGTPVVALDRTDPDAAVRAHLEGVEDLVAFRRADITRSDWAGSLAHDRIDAVVHAAAVTSIRPEEERRAAEAALVNVAGTAHVVGWAARSGVRRVVVVSSAAVYGPVRGPEPIAEGRMPQPDTIYGITKLAGESLARRIGALAGMEVVVARLSHVYGPMERPTEARHSMSPVFEWVRAAVAREPLRSRAPDLARDFIHVADVADALRLMLVAPLALGDVFNVASGRWITEAEAIDALRALAPGATAKVERGAAPAVSRSPVSSERLSRWTGWAPRYSFEAGCRQYLEWIRSRGNAWTS